MPWRLIVFLIFLAVVVVFAGFNTGNATNISFGFYTVENVPIFLSLFASFFLGVLITLPFTMFRSSKKKQKLPKEKKESRKSRKKRKGSTEPAEPPVDPS